MELKVKSNHDYINDFEDIIRAFAPHAALGEGVSVSIDYAADDSEYSIILSDNNGYSHAVKLADTADMTQIKLKSELKRVGKIMLYDYISSATGVALPYGSLTGIRPTKLYHDIASSGIDAYRYFIDYLRVSEAVTRDIKQIVENQAPYITTCERDINLFVNIPICKTRCAYCSFLAMTYQHAKPYLDDYINILVEEIAHAIKLIADSGRRLRTIYVGGGTPTSINDEEFARVMAALSGLGADEFTLEAGRPDSINAAKLHSMRAAGVTRISVNPQTFKEETLIKIGRSHTNAELMEAYNMARELGFDINMDLIAMLPEESLEDYRASLMQAIACKPENITLHTLAMKRGSTLKLDGYDNNRDMLAQDMINLSKVMMKEAGYQPYYMYKQKYMSGSLENTGYAISGKACVYNIDIMEETQSILACGAGGISKRIFSGENRIERLANPKGLDIYIERRERILKDKEAFFNSDL